MKSNSLSNLFSMVGITVFFFITLIFTSCAHKLPPLEKRLMVRLSNQYAQGEVKSTEARVEVDTKESQQTSLVEGGKFREVAPLKYRGPASITSSIEKHHFSKEKMVVVEADGMPMPDFIHYVFSELLGVNYVMDNRIKTSSTLISLDIHNKISEQRPVSYTHLTLPTN